jgi:hypothetical protein
VDVGVDAGDPALPVAAVGSGAVDAAGGDGGVVVVGAVEPVVVAGIDGEVGVPAGVGVGVVGVGAVGVGVVGAGVEFRGACLSAVHTSCWVTWTGADLAVPSTFTTVWAVTAPAGAASVAVMRVQFELLTARALPPVHERNAPSSPYHDTVMWALAPDLALTSEAKVQVSPGRTLTLGSRTRVVLAVDVTRAAQEASTWSETATRRRLLPPSCTEYPRWSDTRVGLGDRFIALEDEPLREEDVAAPAVIGISSPAITTARIWVSRRARVPDRCFLGAAWEAIVVPRTQGARWTPGGWSGAAVTRSPDSTVREGARHSADGCSVGW